MEIALESSADDVAGRISEFLQMRMPEGIIGKLKMLPMLAGGGRVLPQDREHGPCKEVIRQQDFSLDYFRVLKCWPHDGGPSSRLPMVFSKIPIPASANCGCYRMQVVRRAHHRDALQTHKQGRRHYRRASAPEAASTPPEGGLKKMDVAVAIGGRSGDHVFGDSAAASGHRRDDDRGIPAIQARRNGEGETVDIEVPANAEIVLEGYVELGELAPRGSVRRHTGSIRSTTITRCIHVTCDDASQESDYATTIVGPPPAWRILYMGKAIRTHISAAECACN